MSKVSVKVTFEQDKSILEKGTASVNTLPSRIGNVFTLYQDLLTGGDINLKKHLEIKRAGILGFHNDVG